MLSTQAERDDRRKELYEEAKDRLKRVGHLLPRVTVKELKRFIEAYEVIEAYEESVLI